MDGSAYLAIPCSEGFVELGYPGPGRGTIRCRQHVGIVEHTIVGEGLPARFTDKAVNLIHDCHCSFQFPPCPLLKKAAHTATAER